MGKVNCDRCKKLFDENIDRWPSTVCAGCSANTTCSKCKTKKVKVDPTIQHGLEWCEGCRMLACHFCGKVDVTFQEKACPKCYGQHLLCCSEAKDCHSNLICMPSHLKVPPSTYIALQVSSEQRQIAQKQIPIVDKKLPLRLGNPDQKYTFDDSVNQATALDTAIDIYTAILKTRLKSFDGRNLSFTNEESTYAVTLLLGGIASYDHYRIIVTYSQYNRTYTDTNLRKNPTIDQAMIEADPEYELTVAGTHRIRKEGTWHPYVRDAANDHHAEARALQFATANSMLILNIFPTKDYCTTGPRGGCAADVSKRLTAEPFKQNNIIIGEIFRQSKS